MNNQKPRNASEALRLATIAERAQAIITEGYTFEENKDGDYVSVIKPGRLAADYFIMSGVCDCPARQKEQMCKHELAWQMVQEERAITAQAELHFEGIDYPEGPLSATGARW